MQCGFALTHINKLITPPRLLTHINELITPPRFLHGKQVTVTHPLHIFIFKNVHFLPLRLQFQFCIVLNHNKNIIFCHGFLTKRTRQYLVQESQFPLLFAFMFKYFYNNCKMHQKGCSNFK